MDNELSKDSESVTFAQENSCGDSPAAVAQNLRCGKPTLHQSVLKIKEVDETLNVNDETLDGFSIEENTMMSVNGNGEDEDSQQSHSQSTNKSVKRKRLTHVDQSLGAKIGVSQLHVYKWPQDEPAAELYMLQEQLSDFLEVKSFKRKYPEVFRRTVDIKERQYLRDGNIVSETQCDLGLTALKLSEIMDIMSAEYPEKYKEFNDYLNEKRRLAVSNQLKKRPEAKTKLIDSEKMKEMINKAMKSASNYNKRLQREKQEERETFFRLANYENSSAEEQDVSAEERVYETGILSSRSYTGPVPALL